MFNELLNFSLKRNARSAIGFYLAHFLMAILIGMLLGATGGTLGFIQDFDDGIGVGATGAAIYTLIIGLVVANKKKLGFPYYLLVVISSTLAVFAGAIISMIPIAYMTTRENK
jgi:hypothetical protein